MADPMMPSDLAILADRLVVGAVRLTRRLRTEDPAPRLSGPLASALAVIVHAARIKPSDLARLEQVRRPAIARILKRLEADGLVMRQAGVADGRVSWVMPTQKGADLIREGQVRRIAPLIADLEHLTSEELVALRQGAELMSRLGVRRRPRDLSCLSEAVPPHPR